MANHTYSKGLLYKKTLNSSGEVTGSVPLLLKTLGSLVIMSDGTDAETAISTAISNMVTPDETTIVTGPDGITISVKKSTSAEIDEILGDVPTSHTWEGYYTKSETEALIDAVDDKISQSGIETALGYTPIPTTAKGSNNGVAELDATGKVPASQLPSYVDDVIESATYAALPATGEAGKIYVTLNDDKTYRWSGSAYVEISASLALGETSSTAYRGDRGKTAYDHSQATHARTDATNAAIVSGKLNINGTATNIGDFKAVSTAASQGLTDTEKTNALANIGAVPNSDFVVAEQNILYDKLWTRKNLLKLSSSISSAYGLTFTSNTDGSLTVTGQYTMSSGSYAPYITATFVLQAGTYVLSGCPSGGGESTYQLDIIAPAYYPDQGSGVEFTLSTATTIQVRCRIAQTTAIDKKFYPMICEKEVYDSDSSFVCYSAPNSDLTVLEAEDRAALAEEINAGAKNVWDFANAAFGRDSTNCTYTKTNTSITVSSSGGWSYVSYALPLKAGSYVLSGVLSNVNIPTGALPMIRIATSSNGDGALQTVDVGGDQNYILKFTAPSDATYYVLFSPNWQSPSYVAGYTISNIMICTKAAFSVSPKFVPYRPNYDLVYDAIRKVNLTLVLTEYTVNSCSFTNTTAYKCNGLVVVSTRFSVDTALGISQGRQILTVYGAVAPTGSHIIIAMYDGKPLMCWISGQSIFLRNDTELPSGAVIYITGTYPCT